MAYIKKEPIVEFITKGLNNPDKTKAYGYDAIEILTEIEYAPEADVVSTKAFEQVKWERDTAIEQLQSYGVGFCENKELAEVKHGENIGTLHPVDEFICSECGIVLEGWTKVVTDEDDGEMYFYEYEFKYCPNCGAKMDGGKKE